MAERLAGGRGTARLLFERFDVLVVFILELLLELSNQLLFHLTAKRTRLSIALAVGSVDILATTTGISGRKHTGATEHAV
jgi:hypothetical protein